VSKVPDAAFGVKELGVKELGMAAGRFVSIAVGAGVVATPALLTEPAQVAEVLKPVVARAAIADPPAVPCRKQEWYNADRGCLSWTAPRVDLREQQVAKLRAPLLSR
jgi:hypothetical protein